jgi:hypothetical protein
VAAEGGEAPGRRASSWAEWAKPRRWLSFAQRIFSAEQELLTLGERIAAQEVRIRDLERALDRQAGQLDSLNRYIEAKVSLEVSRAAEKLGRGQ